MYSTKLLHKNMVDGNAYITIGDPFSEAKQNPFRQSKKSDKPPFHTKAKPPNEENGYFTKVVYKGGGYQESIKYITTQPLDSRKKGFGTKDAKRRDEFSNIVRTEQYRETLRKEQEILKLDSVRLKEELDQLLEKKRSTTAPTYNLSATSDSADFSYDSHVPLYDIGRTRVTPFNAKSAKDTFYQFNGQREKRLGLFRPTSTDVGSTAWDITYKPPQYGGRSETKNFFDKSHLNVAEV